MTQSVKTAVAVRLRLASVAVSLVAVSVAGGRLRKASVQGAGLVPAFAATGLSFRRLEQAYALHPNRYLGGKLPRFGLALALHMPCSGDKRPK